MTIGGKIAAGFGLAAAILIAAGLLFYWTMARLIENTYWVTHTHEVLTGVEGLLTLLREAESGQRGYLLTGEKTFLEPYESAAGKIHPAITALKDLTSDNPHQGPRLDALEEKVDERLRELKDAIATRDQPGGHGLDAAAQQVRTNYHKQTMTEIRTLVGEIEGEERDLLEQRSAAVSRSVLIAKYTVGLGTVLGVVLLGGFGVLIVRSITLPVREGVARLASTSSELLATTAQQGSGAQQQAAAVSQTVTTVTEVAQTAEQSAQRARQVGETVQHTLEVGKAGRKAVEDSIAALWTLKDRIGSTAEDILALADRAQAIGEIINTVNEIAEQTNLLALNAAIEASRAGEHGRGFSVVASEVKALADQSRKATAQVRQILGDIQKATSRAVVSTEAVSQGVTSAVKVSNQTGDTIKSLAETLTATVHAMAQIVASAGQQSVGMTQIREAMTNLDQVARQNLAGARQVEQAAQHLSELGTRLIRLVGG